MAFKIVFALCGLLAVAHGGFLGGVPSAVSYTAQTPAVTSQSSNILRSPGNLAQISTYSKTIDTPFSSVSKSDVRVSNPGIYSTVQYAAPAYQYAAPAYQYAAPAYQYAAPAQVYAKAAPLQFAKSYAYAAPAVAAPIVKSHLAYDAVPAVAAPGPVLSHTTFTGLGTHYAF